MAVPLSIAFTYTFLNPVWLVADVKRARAGASDVDVDEGGGTTEEEAVEERSDLATLGICCSTADCVSV